jgi:Flp pilus assembly protein TadD
LLQRLFPSSADAVWYRNLPFLAAAFFAVHPVHSEVVATIKGRDDLLSLLLGLSALLVWLRYVETKALAAATLSGVLLFLGMLSKESTVSFLAAGPIVLWYFTRRAPREIAVATWPFVVAALGYVALRFIVSGTGTVTIAPELMNEPFLHAQGGQRLATILLTWLVYLKLLVFPHPLTHDYYPYHIPLVDFSNPLVIVSVVVTALLVYLMVRGVARRTIVSFCLAWSFATFVLVSNLFLDIGTFMNERYLYVPSIAFSILIAWALIEHVADKRIVASVSVLLILVASGKTFARNFAWKDDITLALTDVETSRGSARAQAMAGWAHLTLAEDAPDSARKTAELGKALEHLRASLSITDDFYASINTMGLVLTDSGRYAEALGYYETCFRMKPRNHDVADAVRYIAEKTTAAGDFPVAIRAYEILIAQEPTAALYASLAQLYGQRVGDMAKAEESFQKALQLDPRNSTALGNLGIVYAMTGRSDEAIALFDRALAADPGNARMYLNKGKALRQLGRIAEAEQMTERAVQLDPSLAR